MRLSDLAGKEIINLGDGGRLGLIEDCDLYFDAKSGRIEAILLPDRNSIFHLFSSHQGKEIPWMAIKRIGDEVIIVDLSNTTEDSSMGFYRERRRRTY